MKTKLAFLLAALVLLCAHAPSVRADDDVPAVAPSIHSSQGNIDPQVAQLVHKVSDFYAGMKSVTMTMRASIQVDAPEGKKEMESVYDIEVQKPNRMSFAMETGRMGGTAKSDGQTLYLFSPQLGMFMKSPAPTDLSQVFAQKEFGFISGGFSGLSLFEAIASSDPYAAIMDGVTAANIVGSEQIDGISTQHVHFTQKDVSWDLWVETGDSPWIRRVQPDVSKLLMQFQQPGKDMKMVLNINYTGLASNPDLPISDFVFSPPADAKEVASFFKSPGKEGAEAAENPIAKKPAPVFEIGTVDGGKFDLASHKDKDVVVLNFWTTWVPACRRVLPVLLDVAKTYYPKGVQLLAVNEMEDPAKIQQYLNDANLDFNIGLDRTGDVGQSYHVSGLPLTVIIGRDGVVRTILLGFPADLKDKLSSELDAALAGDAAPAAQ